MKDFSSLEESISYTFKNKDLLREGLTHRSYLNEHPKWDVPHNERLEFLGDAVLELAVSRELFVRHREYTEGQLTSFRAALVNSHMLARVGKEIGLQDHILLSRGEAKDTGRARNAIIANAMEALIGAIYMDSGFDEAATFVEVFILRHLAEVIEKKLWKDPKSRLQELVQERRSVTPNYKVLDEWGPDHRKMFRIGVYYGSEFVAKGEGLSKQEAEVQAAEAALEIELERTSSERG